MPLTWHTSADGTSSHLVDSPPYSSGGEPTEIAQNGTLFVTTWRPRRFEKSLPQSVSSIVSNNVKKIFCFKEPPGPRGLVSPQSLRLFILLRETHFHVEYPESSVKLSGRQALSGVHCGAPATTARLQQCYLPLLCQYNLPSNRVREEHNGSSRATCHSL